MVSEMPEMHFSQSETFDFQNFLGDHGIMPRTL